MEEYVQAPSMAPPAVTELMKTQGPNGVACRGYIHVGLAKLFLAAENPPPKILGNGLDSGGVWTEWRLDQRCPVKHIGRGRPSLGAVRVIPAPAKSLRYRAQSRRVDALLTETAMRGPCLYNFV